MTTGPDGFSTAETLEHEPPRRRFPRSLLLAATTAVVVVAGAGVAAAAAFSTPPSGTPTPTASPTASPTATSSPEKDRSWGRHRMGFGIRGEFVVPDGNGGYRTIATQHGEVTAVDQDSVTVKSEDGHTREYAVNADTRINRDAGIDAVRTGQQVRVVATVEGDTATAVSIQDTSLRGERGRHRWGDRHHWGDKPGWGHGRHHDRRGEPPADSPTPATPAPDLPESDSPAPDTPTPVSPEPTSAVPTT